MPCEHPVSTLCALGGPSGMKNAEGQSLHGAGCNCANDRAQVVYGPGSKEAREPQAVAPASMGVSIVGVESVGGKAKMHLSCGCAVTLDNETPTAALLALLASHVCGERPALALVRA